MSASLFACVLAAEFPAQALLRLHTALESEPVAIVEGRPPLETVCSLNRQARLKGAVPGMPRLEAEGIAGLRLLQRSVETETAARAVLLECAAQFSPRIELASQGTACACVLDITGMARLFGPPDALAEKLRSALAAAGFRTSIAVSANFHVARLKAAAARGIVVIPKGEEATALSRLSLAFLGLPAEQEETFDLWGIRTLGELAALPVVELVTRLGARALQWRELACGAREHAFQPIEAEFALRELCEFETPVEDSDSLLFVGARMIDCLVARAAGRALSLASLVVHMELAGGRVYRRVIRPAVASTDRKFLLKLLQLEIAAHPPPAEVLRMTLTADPGQSSKVQLGLFAPQTPESSRLDVTIARLKAIAGDDRVGSPQLEDSHRPGSFRMESFSVTQPSGAPEAATAARPRMALRRMRPPTPIQVELHAAKPAAFRDNERRYKIRAAYGPWKTSGCWWSGEGWDAEEWDVLAETNSGAAVSCLLVRNFQVHENGRSVWQLEAFYD